MNRPLLSPELARCRRTHGSIVALVLAAQVAASAVARHWPAGHPWLRALPHHALPDPWFGVAAGLLGLALLGGMMMGPGRLRFADLGITRRGLGEAALATAVFWLALQAIAMAVTAVQHGAVVIYSGARPDHVGAMAGGLAAEFLGAPLVEGIIYRGFLLVQIGLWLRRPLPWDGPRMAVALMLSQAWLALVYGLRVPPMVYGATLVRAYLLTLVVAGVLYALVYLRTGNLLIAVGVHALMHAPTPLFGDPGLLSRLVWLVALSLLFSWGRPGRSRWAWLGGRRKTGGSTI